jgi:hypothetical protein
MTAKASQNRAIWPIQATIWHERTRARKGLWRGPWARLRARGGRLASPGAASGGRRGRRLGLGLLGLQAIRLAFGANGIERVEQLLRRVWLLRHLLDNDVHPHRRVAAGPAPPMLATNSACLSSPAERLSFSTLLCVVGSFKDVDHSIPLELGSELPTVFRAERSFAREKRSQSVFN